MTRIGSSEHNGNMRFGLIDLLFLIACLAIGVAIGEAAASDLPRQLRPFVGLVAGVGVYLGLVYPFYRLLRLSPMILPRCPCCRGFQHGFHILGSWPRIIFRCPSCNGEFVIWFNGAPDDSETWDRPVLALKWPYALGRYRRLERPEPSAAANRSRP